MADRGLAAVRTFHRGGRAARAALGQCRRAADQNHQRHRQNNFRIRFSLFRTLLIASVPEPRSSHNCGAPVRRNPEPCVHRPWCRATRFPAATSTAKKPSITAFSTLRLPSLRRLRRRPLVLRPSSDHGSADRDERRRNNRRHDSAFPAISSRSDGFVLRQIARPDRRLAVAAGNIEHVFRLAQAGHPAAQASASIACPCSMRGAQMRGAGREIAVVQVIGFDPAFDESPHQRFQRRRIVIDAAQQHRSG